jgi:uncharacterized protein YbjQ (UPF0145 family)
MLMVTTESVPGYEIKEVFGVVSMQGSIAIAEKGFIRAFWQRKRNKHQDLIDGFAKSAPLEANAIIGIRTSTSSQAFADKTLLIVLLTGTAAKIEKKA